jgi:hypothetical protein
MYYKIDGKNLLLKKTFTSEYQEVPLVDSLNVASITYHPVNDAVYIVANTANSRKKVPSSQYTLFRWNPGDKKWIEIYNKQCFNPVPMPQSSDIVIDTGFGVAILNQDGNTNSECNYQRIAMSPRNQSPSPDGTHIIFSRYRNNDKRFVLYKIAENITVEYKPSWSSYCWFENNTIIFENGSSIRLLSLPSQKLKTFDISKTQIQNIVNPEFQIKMLNYQQLQIHYERIYFVCLIIGITPQDVGMRKERIIKTFHQSGNHFEERNMHLTGDVTTSYWALFSIDKEARQLKLEFLCPPKHSIEDYTVDADGTILLLILDKQENHSKTKIRVIVGDKESPLNDGWSVMFEGKNPELLLMPLQAII